MKRIFDIIISIVLSLFLSIPMLFIALIVKLTSQGPVLYWSDRVGIMNNIFRMPKFRTMKLNTPDIATHLLTDPDNYYTPIGPLLRRYSLDELPQLWSVLRGDMSFVGPRPALFNQDDLILMRTEKRVHTLIPGITGWAQINGRDELPISVKVEYDAFYLNNRSFLFDMKILMMTFFKVLKREGIQH